LDIFLFYFQWSSQCRGHSSLKILPSLVQEFSQGRQDFRLRVWSPFPNSFTSVRSQFWQDCGRVASGYIFTYQKSQFGYILEGLAMGNVCTYIFYIFGKFGILYRNLVYFNAIWYIYGHLISLWSFGILPAHFGIF
jgi:hypothetical protein